MPSLTMTTLRLGYSLEGMKGGEVRTVKAMDDKL